MKEVSFPEGIELVPTYDRSGLILDATHTLQKSCSKRWPLFQE